MIRTNTTDAFTTTCVILFVIALFTGNDSTGLDWLIRAACIYPFTHLAWRSHRHQHRRLPHSHKLCASWWPA